MLRYCWIFLFFCIWDGFVFSQDPFSEDPLSLFDDDALDLCFVRADRSFSRTDWQMRAELGAEAVISSWEKKVLLLFGGDYDISPLRDSIQESVDREMTDRFIQWITARFFQEKSALNLEAVYASADSANTAYLSVTDDTGKPLYDSLGDPVLRKKEDLQEDLFLWQGLTQESPAEGIALWEDQVRNPPGELLRQIPGEGEGAFLNLYGETFEEYRQGMLYELEKCFYLEQKRFLEKRGMDQFSLRRKEDRTSADSIAHELAMETSGEVQEGIDRLRKSIREETVFYLDSPDLDRGDDWLENCRKEIEQGIAAWDALEQRLLQERIDWEAETEKAFTEGGEEWYSALDELNKARHDWEKEIYSVIDEGEILWEKKFAELEQEIAETRDTLSSALEERNLGIENQQETIISVMSTSRELMNAARETGEYYLECLIEDLILPENDSIAPEFGTHDFAEYISAIEEECPAKDELLYWNSIYAESADRYGELNADLTGIYNSISEDLVYEKSCDDLQQTLYKAEAAMEYWEEQLAVARAVYEYAADTSSERPQEEETDQAYLQAVERYESALNRYRVSASELEKYSDDIVRCREDLDKFFAELQTKRMELDNLNQEYSVLFSVYASDNEEYFADKLDALSKELAEVHHGGGLNPGIREQYHNIFTEYGKYISALAFEKSEEEIEALAEGRIEGDLSIDELHVREQKGEEWEFLTDRAGFLSSLEKDLSLEESSPYYQLFIQLFDICESASDADEKDTAEACIRRLSGYICDFYQWEAGKRERALELLTGGSFQEWYGPGGEGLTSSEIMEMIKEKDSTREEFFLREKAVLEKAAFESFLFSGGSLDTDSDADFLAALFSFSAGMDSNEKETYALERARELEGFLENSGPYQAASNFNAFGIDFGEIVSSSAFFEMQKRQTDLRICEEYMSIAPALKEYFMEQAGKELEVFLCSNNLAYYDSSGSVQFYSPDEAVQSFSASAEDLFGEIDRRFENINPVLHESLTGCCKALSEYQRFLLTPGDFEEDEKGHFLMYCTEEYPGEAGNYYKGLEQELYNEAADGLVILRDALSLLYSPGAGNYSGEDNSAELLQELQILEQALREDSASLGVLKKEILDIGYSLTVFRENRSGVFKNILKPCKEKIEEVKSSCISLEEAWEASAEEFRNAVSVYNRVYEDGEELFSALEKKRGELVACEQILEYAQSRYLHPADPGTAVEKCRIRFERAREVWQMLKSLDDERSSPDPYLYNPEYREAFDAFRSDYQELLYVKEFSQVFDKASALQLEKVSQWHERVEKSLDALVLPEEENRETWASSMSSLLYNKGKSAFSEMLSRWGLAHWHLMKIQGESDRYEPLAGDIFAGSGPREILAQEGISFSGYVADAAASAYYRVMGNPGEKELFSYYVSCSLDNFLPDNPVFSFLKDSVILSGKEYISRELDRKISVYEAEAKQYEEGAAAAQMMSFLFPPYQAVVFGLIASASSSRNHAKRLEEVKNTINRNYSTISSSVISDKNLLIQKLYRFSSDKKSLAEEEGILKVLCCTKEDGSEITVKEITGSVISAFSIAGKEAPLSRLQCKRLFSRITGLLPEDIRAGASDGVSLLRVCAEKGESLLDASRESLKKAAGQFREEQSERTVLFAEAAADYFSTGTGFDICQTSAEKSFLNPVFSEPAYSDRMFSTLQDLRFRNSYSDSRLLAEEVGTAVEKGDLVIRGVMETLEYMWLLRRQELSDRKDLWQARINTVAERGEKEWDTAFDSLCRKRDNWEYRFQERYQDTLDLWNRKYRNFLEGKSGWIQSADREVIEELSPGIPVCTAPFPDLDLREDVEDALDNSLFHQCIQGAGNLSTLFDPIKTTLHSPVRRLLGNTLSAEKHLLELQEKRNVELAKHFALVSAEEAFRTVRSAEKQLFLSLAEANRSVRTSLERALFASGYTRKGALYVREAVVGATAADGTLKEIQQIPVYVPFSSPDVTGNGSHAPESFAGLTKDGIYAVIEKELEGISEIWKRIFGYSADGISAETVLQKTLVTEERWKNEIRIVSETNEVTGQTREVEKAFKKKYLVTNTLSRTVYRGLGEFGAYAGFAPEFKKDALPDKSLGENILFPGEGEIGRIIGAFMQDQLEEGFGWKEFTTPVYDRRLWDDEGRTLKAPTLRQLADTGMTAASVLLGAGPAGSALLNLADDLLFTGADIKKGNVSLGAGIGRIVRKGTQGLFVSGIGGTADTVLQGLQHLSGLQGVMAEVSIQGLKEFYTALGSGMINLPEGYGSLLGEQEAGRIASHLAGTAVTRGLSGGIEGFSDYDKSRITSFTGSVGSAVQVAAAYGLTGEAVLNVLNTRDLFQGGSGSTGLLELHLGNSGGHAFEIGTRGIDASLSGALDAVRGFDVWKENNRIRQFTGNVVFADCYTGWRDAGTALRELYSFGDTEGKALYQRLLQGDDTLKVGYISNPGMTSRGETGNIIHLAVLGSNRDERLLQGIILEHESIRNGIVEGNNRRETEDAVKAHTEMMIRLCGDYGYSLIKENPALQQDLYAYMQGDPSFSRYVNTAYSSTGDFWKLTEKGTLVWDGKTSLYDWNGNLLIDDTARSMSRALARYLGFERAEEILGKPLDDLSAYDEQTLLDVTGYTEHQLKCLASASGTDAYDSLSLEEKQKLAGEALMKSRGMAWEGQWTGGENVLFTFTDLMPAGRIYISNRLLSSGEYEKFTVSASVSRDPLSYTSEMGDLVNQRLDSVRFVKQDLAGEIISSLEAGSVHTVDVMLTNKNHDNLDQYFYHPVYGKIQGNTIAPGSFYTRFGMDSAGFDEPVWVMHDTKTIDGTRIYSDGNADPAAGRSGRWLWHQNRTAGKEEDFVNACSDGCFIFTTDDWCRINTELYDWGLQSGYDIATDLQMFK